MSQCRICWSRTGYTRWEAAANWINKWSSAKMEQYPFDVETTKTSGWLFMNYRCDGWLMRDLCVTSDTPTPSHPANVDVRVRPCDCKHDDQPLLSRCPDIKRRCIYTRCRGLVEAPVENNDWLAIAWSASDSEMCCRQLLCFGETEREG